MSTPTPTHTPTPWFVDDRREFADEIAIGVEHPEVGFVSHAAVRSGCDEADELGDMLENARQIVRSVNAYDELVKALIGCIKAAHEAKDQLNRRGIACPAGVALAAETAWNTLRNAGIDVA
jgi:hypothetical protein